MRKNEKKNVVSFKNTLKKSNEFSMARLNAGLSLNQMQLMAFAIYSTQQGGLTTFNKYEFEQKFDIGQYRTDEANEDVKKLYELGFATVNLEENEFDYLRVFQRISYKDGEFSFEWSNALLPHIINLKENFVLTDLTITSRFKSSFSWILYDFMKASYGAWYKTLSKEELMRLFNVENRQTYLRNTSEFKRGVLDVAIAEINEHTEYECWYTEKKVGRKITHFTLHFSVGEKVTGATQKQLETLRTIVKAVLDDMIEYISLKDMKNVEEARKHILAVHDIEDAAKRGDLTKDQADIQIKNANYHLKQLERIKERDSKASPFYNWLEERD